MGKPHVAVFGVDVVARQGGDVLKNAWLVDILQCELRLSRDLHESGDRRCGEDGIKVDGPDQGIANQLGCEVAAIMWSIAET